jgi:hypothetical protein
MGAVQDSAPNLLDNRGGWHCYDEEDVMCYGRGTERVCTQEHFDYNHDDYVHPHPPADSYLDEHWNVAGEANGSVQTADRTELPSAPQHLTAAPGSSPGSVRLQWQPPEDPDSSPTERYVVYRDTTGAGLHDQQARQVTAPDVLSIAVDDLETLRLPGPTPADQLIRFEDRSLSLMEQAVPRTYTVSAVTEDGEDRLGNPGPAHPAAEDLPILYLGGSPTP